MQRFFSMAAFFLSAAAVTTGIAAQHLNPSIPNATPSRVELPTGEHWRLVFPDRTAAIDGPWEERSEIPPELLAVWYWSESVAPIRLRPTEIARFEKRPTAGRFVHRRGAGVARPAPSTTSGATDSQRPPAILIAGPREMWQEVPEDLLPHWPWPTTAAELQLPRLAGSRWQMRLLDDDRGTFWVAPPRGAASASLPALPAAGRRVAAVNSAGMPLAGLRVDILRAAAEDSARALLALYSEPASGRIVIPSLPDSEPIVAVVKAPGFVPITWQGLPASLPELFRLAAGTSITGRLVDAEGAPITGVEVLVETWLAGDFPSYLVRGDDSDSEGIFELSALPAGRARLLIRGRGLAPISRDLELAEGGLDLGELTLGRGSSLTLEIRGNAGAPIVGARVTAVGAPDPYMSDIHGRLTVEGIDPEAPLELTVAADGYIPKDSKLFPPYPAASEIRLDSAFVIVGMFLDEKGAPVVEGRMMAKEGRRTLTRELEGAGAFEFTLPAGTAFELRLLAAAGGEARLALAPGEPGERRQLGELRALPARRILGRLVAAGDGAPVAGARAWLPRPGSDHEAIVAYFGDFLSASSGADGTFELGGLPPGGALLRIDAPGFARHTVRLPAGDSNETADLGDIVLDQGAELEVAAPDVRDGAAVRLDLGRRQLEIDKLKTSVYGGVAQFLQVPSGPAIVSVEDGGKLLCEKEIALPDSGLLRVDCSRATRLVSGRVTRGGLPPGEGRLVFGAPAAEAPQFIRRQATPGGLHNDQLLGLGRPPVEVAVAADGFFETDDLLPGRWRVGWATAAAYGSEIEIEIADAEETVLQLEFPAFRVAGRVVDPQGRAIPGARVSAAQQGLFAQSDPAGNFLIEGIASGESWLVAEKDGERSPAVAALVAEDGSAEEVRLVLGAPRREGKVEVQVLLPEGDSAASALVFLETAEGAQRLVSADLHGIASFEIDRPFPSRLRVGAFASGQLSLGNFLAFSEDMDRLELQLGETGSLVLSAKTTGRPALRNAQGWDIGWWLSRLGRLPIAEEGRELAIDGLPAGSYSGTLGGQSFAVEVEPGEVATVAMVSN